MKFEGQQSITHFAVTSPVNVTSMASTTWIQSWAFKLSFQLLGINIANFAPCTNYNQVLIVRPMRARSNLKPGLGQWCLDSRSTELPSLTPGVQGSGSLGAARFPQKFRSLKVWNSPQVDWYLDRLLVHDNGERAVDPYKMSKALVGKLYLHSNV
jgi:hypothetical protein